jgi:aspartyl protease family protein
MYHADPDCYSRGAMEHAWNADLAYKIILLVALVAGFIAFARSSRMRIGTVVRYALIWIAIAVGIAAAYTVHEDVESFGARMLADFLPSRGMTMGPHSIAFKAANDGHFHVDAVVDGVGLKMLVDTGATVVSLSRRDAARVGIDVSRLTFTQRVQTANGTVLAAPVTLRELRVGPIALANVRAADNDGRTEESLLGVSFLGRLQSYTVSGKTLTLTGPAP